MSIANAATPSSRPQAIYDSNPQHLWNRLADALFVRTAPDNGDLFGTEELDILYWESTKHLLTSPSRQNAIKLLDEFIRSHGERLISDPVKRALLQRDLWALFDWSVDRRDRPELIPAEAKAKADLQQRLVTIMKRLALSVDEINGLADVSAEAEKRLNAEGFPQALFASDSPWVLIGNPGGPTTPEHTISFGGRSVFLVFVKFPGGREQALQYLKQLREYAPALVYPEKKLPFQDSARLTTNPQTPQFPANTQWALVRMACLIDDHGAIHATRLIESVQTRTYLSIPEVNDIRSQRAAQVVSEFQLDRKHAPLLRAVAQGERDFQFVHFQSMGADSFEQNRGADWASHRDEFRGETLRTCGMCHQPSGILSVNTYANFGMTANNLGSSTLDSQTREALVWKAGQFDWGLLKGLWRQ